MIFKRLFQPGYQHPDANVRLASLERLDPAKAEHKSLLHELAFNDASTSVRLAALERLDSFAIWWKLAQTDNNERVRKVAQRRSETVLLSDNHPELPPAQRKRFVDECRNHSLLEKLLLKQWQHLPDTGLSLNILKKLNKDRLNQQVIFESDNARLAETLLESVQDPKALSRISKKHPNPQLKSQATKKLNEINQLQQLAAQTEKAARLTLSKMQVLSHEATDAEFKRRYIDLKQEFEKQKLHLLSVSVQQDLQGKYTALLKRLDDKHL
ncbi:hypothetical protein [Lacimicrobium alkaliphilum]|uniref:HEAT repeat domain-containing protein n=1 Tax=Lacimicrobium alkaliphilum TaxID=1526571 RepID=A0ABQ1RBQ0_9ALTE|nr:hypothetical protein [Lacimicrobium alkaliphilum]GGD64326.1 hypothetical protein GCM10011357_19630 [Lacimicrobium alkaliphilum]